MPSLDPAIVEHHIDTWPNASPVWQKQRPLHPSKALDIKAEIDKLYQVGFVYLIAYTSWVSDPILVNKNQGTICICTDFQDLDQACSKEKIPP